MVMIYTFILFVPFYSFDLYNFRWIACTFQFLLYLLSWHF